MSVSVENYFNTTSKATQHCNKTHKDYFDKVLFLLPNYHKTNQILLQVQDKFKFSSKPYKDYFKKTPNNKAKTTTKLFKYHLKTTVFR